MGLGSEGRGGVVGEGERKREVVESGRMVDRSTICDDELRERNATFERERV